MNAFDELITKLTRAEHGEVLPEQHQHDTDDALEGTEAVASRWSRGNGAPALPKHLILALVLAMAVLDAAGDAVRAGMPARPVETPADLIAQDLVSEDWSARRRRHNRDQEPPLQGAAAMARICQQETLGSPGETTARVAQAIGPSQEQRAALDELKAAMEAATTSLREACAVQLPMNVVARFETVERQLTAMHDAMQTLRPALEKLDGSLTDEQRTRFGLTTGYASRRDDPRAVMTLCDIAGGLTRWPLGRIGDELRPDFAQRNALIDLWAASAKARNALDAQCPREATHSPFARLRMLDKRVEITRDALRNVRMTLADFYRGLNDEQKARFDQMQLGEPEDDWPSERRRRRR
jgi:hypothetical protein